MRKERSALNLHSGTRVHTTRTLLHEQRKVAQKVGYHRSLSLSIAVCRPAVCVFRLSSVLCAVGFSNILGNSTKLKTVRDRLPITAENCVRYFPPLVSFSHALNGGFHFFFV